MDAYTGPSRTAATVEFITCGKFLGPTSFLPGGLHKEGIAQKVDAHHRQRVVMMHPTHSLRHLFVFLFLLSDGQMGLSAEGGE